MSNGRRRRLQNRKLPKNLYRNRGAFRYKKPDGSFVYLNCSEKEAIQVATDANSYFASKNTSIYKIINHAPKVKPENMAKTILESYTKFKKERTKSERTWEGHQMRIKHLIKEFGNMDIATIDVKVLTDWLDAEVQSYHSWRAYKILLADFFDYAVGVGALQANHGNPARVLIKRIKPAKVRKRLTLEQFNAIYNEADDWLQIAMDIALQTALRLGDIIRLMFEHCDDEHLYVTPNKTQDITDPVHLKIKMGSNLKATISRARSSGIASPFIVHRRPKHTNADIRKRKVHWTQVNQQYVSHAFNDAREKTGLFNTYKKGEAPTFHEIRALSSHLYKAKGRELESVQLLMGHNSQVMTEMYQSGHGIEYAETWADLDI